MKSDEKQLMEDERDLYGVIVQLGSIALASGGHQATPVLRRLARRYRDSRPELAAGLVGLLRATPVRAAATASSIAEPVDTESRMPLVKVEETVLLDHEPILVEDTRAVLAQLVVEHEEPSKLLDAGLSPTRTALFVGPPGVGKTLAARWLARSLGRPLIVLDLASVMSSLLGRTGENVRRVLDYAKQTQCVLLLDELDAVAKRRDDTLEIGELKRLVTVLLQEIDAWPEGGLLVAATNHSDLLDPAVWRRFELVIQFPLPDSDALVRAINEFLDVEDSEGLPSIVDALAVAYHGLSFSDVEREVMKARRTAAMQALNVGEVLLQSARERFRELPTSERIRAATGLMRETGITQRRAHEITGVSRDTLRKYAADASVTDGDGNG
jgi:SpoVK/Ycf46/Vps4 family AAA+-type ATPase